MPHARDHMGYASLGGRHYLVGGRVGWDELYGHLKTVEAFEGATNSWVELAPLPVGTSEIFSATLVTSSGLLVVGGSTAGVTPSDEVWRYQPAANRWDLLTRLPAPRKGAVAARIGNRLVVTAGSATSTAPSDATWIGCCLEDG